MEQENRLIKNAVKGRRGAFEELIRLHQDYLYRMAYLYCREEHAALDVVSETVAKAYVGIRKLRKPEYFRTWLTKILINEALKARKHADIISLEELQEKGIEAQTQEDKEYSREEVWDLQEAVARLPEEMRAMVILKYFQEFSTREIAQIMGNSEGAVRTQLCRARKLLREDLTGKERRRRGV